MAALRRDCTLSWLQGAFCKGSAAVLPSSKFSCIFVVPSHHKGVAVTMRVGKEFGCVPVVGRALQVTHLPKPAQSPHQQDNPSQNPAGSTFCHGLICSCRYFGKRAEWVRQGRNTTSKRRKMFMYVVSDACPASLSVLSWLAGARWHLPVRDPAGSLSLVSGIRGRVCRIDSAQIRFQLGKWQLSGCTW